jgi:hypothetical protein
MTGIEGFEVLYEIRKIISPDKPERLMLTELPAAVAKLKAAVARLPQTADGVPGADMMKVHSFRYERCGETGTVAMRVNYEGGWDSLKNWCSTRAAAEAARDGK